jgi:hypothetical protein
MPDTTKTMDVVSIGLQVRRERFEFFRHVMEEAVGRTGKWK